MVITIKPNEPDAPNASIALRFHSGRQSRGVGDPERSANSKICPTLRKHESFPEPP
jgi:hypothetical protein